MLPASLLASRTLLYTPEVHVTGRRMHPEIALQASTLGSEIDRALDPTCTQLERAGHRLQHRNGAVSEHTCRSQLAP